METLFGLTFPQIAELIRRAEDLNAMDLLRENVLLAGKVSRYEKLINDMLEIKAAGTYLGAR